jgi:hypothetical protein
LAAGRWKGCNLCPNTETKRVQEITSEPNKDNFRDDVEHGDVEHGERGAWGQVKYRCLVLQPLCAGIVKRVPVLMSAAEERSVHPWFPFGIQRLKSGGDHLFQFKSAGPATCGASVGGRDE